MSVFFSFFFSVYKASVNLYCFQVGQGFFLFHLDLIMGLKLILFRAELSSIMYYLFIYFEGYG